MDDEVPKILFSVQKPSSISDIELAQQRIRKRKQEELKLKEREMKKIKQNEQKNNEKKTLPSLEKEPNQNEIISPLENEKKDFEKNDKTSKSLTLEERISTLEQKTTVLDLDQESMSVDNSDDYENSSDDEITAKPVISPFIKPSLPKIPIPPKSFDPPQHVPISTKTQIPPKEDKPLHRRVFTPENMDWAKEKAIDFGSRAAGHIWGATLLLGLGIFQGFLRAGVQHMVPLQPGAISSIKNNEILNNNQQPIFKGAMPYNSVPLPDGMYLNETR